MIPLCAVFSVGTIMSYCHLVNGNSTALDFGPRASERMRTWIDGANCIEIPEEPMIGITSPRGSDTWAGGSQVTIKWVSSMVTNVNLAYSTNGGGMWEPIASDVPAVDSQYVWTLPNLSASQVTIRIQDASNSSVEAISIADYAISVPLEFISPQGGERLGFGSEFNIRIRKDLSINAVDLEYSLNNGQDWDPIVEGETQTAYTWTVPSTATDQARIRVSNSANKEIAAVSQPFSIGEPRFELLLPAENGELCNNQDNQFNWSGDFIDRIRIQYSTDGGENWRNAMQSLTVEVKDWETFTRNNSLGNVEPGTEVQLQVLEAESREVLRHSHVADGSRLRRTSFSRRRRLQSGRFLCYFRHAKSCF